MIPVVFELEAAQDVLAAFAWYEEQRAGLGALFRDAMDAATLRIAQWPEVPAPQYRDLRRVFVSRFPYAIYYRVYSDSVVVVAVVHGKRHPNIWRKR